MTMSSLTWFVCTVPALHLMRSSVIAPVPPLAARQRPAAAPSRPTAPRAPPLRQLVPIATDTLARSLRTS